MLNNLKQNLKKIKTYLENFFKKHEEKILGLNLKKYNFKKLAYILGELIDLFYLIFFAVMYEFENLPKHFKNFFYFIKKNINYIYLTFMPYIIDYSILLFYLIKDILDIIFLAIKSMIKDISKIFTYFLNVKIPIYLYYISLFILLVKKTFYLLKEI